MGNVIEIIEDLFQDIAASLGVRADLLLYAVVGALLLLLFVLLIAGRKKRGRNKAGAEGSAFLEVGPEPVIVYGRSAEKKIEPQPGEDVAREAEQEPAAEPIATPEPRLPDYIAAPPFTLPDPEPAKTPEPVPILPAPSPTPEVSPFEQFMSAELGQEVAATTFKPALAQEPLPPMESDFAGEVLILFTKQGFAIEKVVYHGTYGADFIVTTRGMRAYVQVKDWKKKATPRTVQEARYYSNTHECHKTILFPVAGYTGAAKREAAKRAVSLGDAKIIKKLSSGQLTIEDWLAAASF